MESEHNVIWQSDTARQFAAVLAAIEKPEIMQQFLRDLLTDKEVVEISARLQAAKMLRAGKKYTEIIAKTKLSSRTVARISDWLQNGSGGYAVALKILGDVEKQDRSHG